MSSFSIKGELEAIDARISTCENTSIPANIATIKGLMEIDTSNNGLTGLSDASDLMNPDANYFDVYYDDSGKPYYFINQFNPLFGNYLSRNGSDARSNACSYASYANGFIYGYGVHSVIDSFGIYMFALEKGRKTNSCINGNEWNNMLKGENSGSTNSQYYKFLDKYIHNPDGSLRYTPTKSGYLTRDVQTFMASGEQSGGFVFVGGPSKDKSGPAIQQMINEAEANGYHVRVVCSGTGGGKSGNVFGSISNSGHYVTPSYSTREGCQVLDSFGNRRTSIEASDGDRGVSWANRGVIDYHEGNRGPNRAEGTGNRLVSGRPGMVAEPNADTNHFWHENSVVSSTDYTNQNGTAFTEFIKDAGISGGGVIYVYLEK